MIMNRTHPSTASKRATYYTYSVSTYTNNNNSRDVKHLSMSLGECITSVLPSDVCPLRSMNFECGSSLNASSCVCDEGFQSPMCTGTKQYII